ncbi:protein yellow-related [Holotrichia oblita]|uniref:Protein yellow-related n=1 Tax=Holotrichia oblita TaxID=644536 RepID=A0ACB9T0I3_HOLOL|nr:protein yellow-related [Holotrichia oblita]
MVNLSRIFLTYLVFETLDFVSSAGLTDEFTWTKLTYDLRSPHEEHSRLPKPNPDAIYFPTDEEGSYKGHTISSNSEDYHYPNNIPMGANRWKDKLFITVPRRRHGIPSTLNYIPLNSSVKHNVPLIPYPDLKTNRIKASHGHNHLISVYRVTVDPCDRLWMVDTGIIEVPGNKTWLGRQKLVIIDLNTDEIIKTYYFKESDLTSKTTLALITVDVTESTCDDAYAYIPDFLSYSLVVYSLKNDDSWRIKHNYFHIEPTKGDFEIGGHKFQWSDGIFSGGLTNIQSSGYRNYIFHAMAGTHLYSVSTRVLRNKKLATRSYHHDDFMVLGDRGNDWQTSASAFHPSSNVMFFALVNKHGVGCWNINNLFSQNSFVILKKDEAKMIYPADLKIYKNDIIILTNRMPVFVYSKLNYDEINFRVWIGNIYDVIRGTGCEDRGTTSEYYG